MNRNFVNFLNEVPNNKFPVNIYLDRENTPQNQFQSGQDNLQIIHLSNSVEILLPNTGLLFNNSPARLGVLIMRNLVNNSNFFRYPLQINFPQGQNNLVSEIIHGMYFGAYLPPEIIPQILNPLEIFFNVERTETIINLENVRTADFLIRDFTHSPTFDTLEIPTIINHMESLGLEVRIIRAEELREIGANLILAVGGSHYDINSLPPERQPRLIIIQWRGAPEIDNVLGLVGKFVRFDTGGLQIKTNNYMQGMNFDNGGGAEVMSAMIQIAQMNLPVNVVAAIPMVYNLVDQNSILTGARIRSLSGNIVQIDNTDAEGRLIMGDAISFLLQRHTPNLIISLATLTGLAAYVFGPRELVSSTLQTANEFRHIFNNVTDQIYTHIVTPTAIINTHHNQNVVKNIWPGRLAAAHEATTFLLSFVEKTPFFLIDRHDQENPLWPQLGPELSIQQAAITGRPLTQIILNFFNLR